MSVPPGWEGILAEGEQILWQGRPVEGVQVADFFGIRLVMGVFFTGFAILWIAGAHAMSRGTGGIDLFPLFGLPFVLVGLFLMIGYPFWDAYARARTWYTLTDRAAFIATGYFGRRALARVPYAEMNILELQDNQPGTVWFKKELKVHHFSHRSSSGRRRQSTSTSIQRTGFRRIEAARAVYRLIADRRVTDDG
ncbi:MAG: hypothetical protein KDK12_16465 [Rhodobacteraceae bacterium]|nr:hypothetical protein [Paracoccaceae bacterium]